MAAASPGANPNVASATTVSGPLGVGYCLLTPVTSSMGARHAAIGLEETVGGPLDRIVGAHLGERAPAQRLEPRPIGPELEQHLGQAVGIVRLDQDTAAGPLNHLGERATARLHDG